MAAINGARPIRDSLPPFEMPFTLFDKIKQIQTRRTPLKFKLNQEYKIHVSNGQIGSAGDLVPFASRNVSVFLVTLAASWRSRLLNK